MLMFIEIVEFISALLLILVILLQNRGTGLGETFGGESNIYTARRSVEKLLYSITIVLSVIFFSSSILLIYLQ